ncbi:DNA polymerase alpha catalytic subunit-like [Aphidius gifuensis]|uniref:DNA polymerase alpha catalytic subunit-like n=1 Tax=Aphidius gifuensis TaxID=684658 RepID=UPI001CDCB7DA|nr:DNA polymerase alpha catalytic subunit-like [Aphidius gifuensis]
MDIDESPSSSGRAKREKKDKHGRAAAFEKLKKLKGTKNKYQVDEIVNVYDVVDEKEFSKKQTALQQEDWIVDDGDGGYIEDGREIFDDDMDPDSIQKNSKEANRLVGPKKRKRDEATKSKNAGGNIMSMIQGMPLKKKREETSQVNHENILEIMLQDLEKEKSSSSSSQKPKVNSKNTLI